MWYIDKRQIENGEFGGGLSDDGDLTNVWPATALMGVEPEKIKASLLRELDAFYQQGMFTDGFPTIQADDLHSYEEGISTLGPGDAARLWQSKTVGARDGNCALVENSHWH